MHVRPGTQSFLLRLSTTEAIHRLDRIHGRQHLDDRRLPACGLFRCGKRLPSDPRNLSLLQSELHAEAGADVVLICTVLCGVLLLGWWLNNGDPSWGRLSFPGKDLWKTSRLALW